jgi:hypothetical protein
VNAEFQAESAFPGQRHEIAWNSHPFESATPLEFSQRAIVPIKINQIGQLLFLANLNALRDQGVVSRFVAMFDT